MRINFVALCVYISTLAGALLSVANVLPAKWLPILLVVFTVTHAFTPRVRRKKSIGRSGVFRQISVPPQTGRRQSGRARLQTLLAMLAVCLSLPFFFAACPKPPQSANANTSQAAGDIKALDRFESDNTDLIPAGVTYTLDAVIRVRLEHARA